VNDAYLGGERCGGPSLVVIRRTSAGSWQAVSVDEAGHPRI